MAVIPCVSFMIAKFWSIIVDCLATIKTIFFFAMLKEKTFCNIRFLGTIFDLFAESNVIDCRTNTK